MHFLPNHTIDTQSSLPLPLPLRPTSSYTRRHATATAKTHRRPPPPSSARSATLPLPVAHFFCPPPRLPSSPPPLWPTRAFPSDHNPLPIAVLLLNRGLISPAFPKCNSSSPGSHFFCPPPPPPLLWPAKSFLSDHYPRPITVLLLLDHGLTSPTFLEVQLFHFLSLPAAAAMASRILPLRSLSPTYRRPPPLRPRPDFPGISRSTTLPLSLPAGCRHLLLVVAAATTIVVVNQSLPL